MNKIVAVLLLLTIYSCRKKDIEPGVPGPVEKHIVEFSKDPVCDDAHVDEYTFQQKTVYVFDYGTCGADMVSVVEDADGKNVGSLGGYSGNMIINGEKFDSATFIRVVWEKKP